MNGPAAAETLSVRLPALRASVTAGRHRLAEFLDRAGVADPYDACLAATEALSNAVRHAYRSEPQGEVELEAAVTPGEITIVVRDTAAAPAAHLAGEVFGLGLALMASLARRVDVAIEAGRGTEVRLTLERAGHRGDGNGESR